MKICDRPEFKSKKPPLTFGENDKVLNAVKHLLSNSDDIEIFNKKAIYLYLREITGLNTKQIVNSLKKFRKKYGNFKYSWDSGTV